MQSLGLITKIGPENSRATHPLGGTDFAIEAEMANGDRVILELTRGAAQTLAKELTIYMAGRGAD
jgi:hypothetical protein